MQLPDDVLSIIRDFSKPLTRPNWRNINPLTGYTLYKEIVTVLQKDMFIRFKKIRLYERIFNHLINTKCGNIYMLVRIYGIEYASLHFNIPISELYKIPGVIHAQYDHKYN